MNTRVTTDFDSVLSNGDSIPQDGINSPGKLFCEKESQVLV